MGEETADSSILEAIRLLQGIARNSNLNAKLWEAALDREVYGGAAFKVTPSLKKGDLIRWNKVPLEGFYPVWDPEDEDNLLEVYRHVEMTREQARARYGYDGDKERVLRVEHWTTLSIPTTSTVMKSRLFRDEPLGLRALCVYAPRIRTDNWWGDALTPDLIAPQNELNARIADMGEAINYNSHPTRWGINLPRSFKADNFPLGPNAFWDLGRSIGSMPEPQVGVLEIKNPVPAEVFTFVNFLYDWTRTSSFLPPIAFGQDNGGGQRSGRHPGNPHVVDGQGDPPLAGIHDQWHPPHDLDDRPDPQAEADPGSPGPALVSHGGRPDHSALRLSPAPRSPGHGR